MKLLRSLSIGRSVDCDICLDEDTVSRRHAQLSLLPGARLQLKDLGSSNGTWLKGSGQWLVLRDEEIDAQAQLRFGEVEVNLQELLAGFPAFAVLFDELAPDDRALTINAEQAVPRHERPRRNPRTGDIEELD